MQPCKTLVSFLCILTTVTILAAATYAKDQQPPPSGFGGNTEADNRGMSRGQPVPPRGDFGGNHYIRLETHSRWNEGAFIRTMYRGFLNREPRQDEVNYWKRLLGERISAAQLVSDFMNSDEYFVRASYLGILGREPDPRGLHDYLVALRSGSSRQDVTNSLVNSQEFATRIR